MHACPASLVLPNELNGAAACRRARKDSEQYTEMAEEVLKMEDQVQPTASMPCIVCPLRLI